MHRNKSWTAIVMAASLTAALAGCGSTTPQAVASASAENTLVISHGNMPSTLDPQVAYDTSSTVITRAAYQRLVTFRGASSLVEPQLATSWTVSADGLVYTFNLRHDVHFSDGSLMTAADVKYSFERLLAINQGPAWLFADIKTISAASPYQVIFTLSKPQPQFLEILASWYGGLIVSEKGALAHTVGKNWAQGWLKNHTDGTGPYEVKELIPNQEVVLVRNPYYWGGWKGSHYQTVIDKSVPSSETQEMLLEHGTIASTDALSVEQLKTVAKSAAVRVLTYPSLNEYYMVMNAKSGPTSNIKVRQALSYAMNYKEVIQDVLDGTGRQAQGPLPYGLFGHDNHLPMYHYDLAKARALLAQAGYPHGGFTLNYVWDTGSPPEEVVGEILQQGLAQLNIKLTLTGETWTTMWNQISNEKTAPSMYGFWWYPDYPDPNDYLTSMYATSAWGVNGYNEGYYSNPEVDSLLTQARYSLNTAQRLSDYTQVQQILNQQAPAIDVYVQDFQVPMNRNVVGYQYNPMSITFYNFYGMHGKS